MEVSSNTLQNTSRAATRSRGRPAQALYMPPARRHREPAVNNKDMRPEKQSPPSPTKDPKIFPDVTMPLLEEKVDLCITDNSMKEIKDITNKFKELQKDSIILEQVESKLKSPEILSQKPKVITVSVENTQPSQEIFKEDKPPRKEEVRVKTKHTKVKDVKCDVLPISLAKNIKKSPIKLVQVDQWEDLVHSDDEPASPNTTVQNNKVVIPKYDDEDAEEFEGLSNDQLEHILEIYDFPSSFKTPDIMQIYNEMDQESMYIKWLSETRALLVLGSAMQAKRALSIENPFLKSRPVAVGSLMALDAVRTSNLRPAMKRPQTSMQAARRMITTALGAKSNVSREVQQRERDALRKAKEEKRTQRQNERDAWDGNPRPTTA